MPSGSRYGSLVVLTGLLTSRVPPNGGRPYLTVWVECDCGVTYYVHAKNLRTGNTTSCGCRTRFKKKTA